ncbi:putative disease resistance protein [Trifolium repens]|nr:putative disease resistance protein [Trifolium repens]
MVFHFAELENFEILRCLPKLRRIRLQQVSVPSLCKLNNLQKLSLYNCKRRLDFQSDTVSISEIQLYFPHSGLQAEFPPNTNILYVDLPSAELVGSSKNVNNIPLPGMVLNTRKPIVYVDQFGRQCREKSMTHSFPTNSRPTQFTCNGVQAGFHL